MLGRSWLVLGFGALVVLTGCPGEPTGIPVLSITARPTRIDDVGEAATLTVDALDEKGSPGKGTVTVKSLAGSLVGAGAPVTLDAKGSGSTTFTCTVASDIGCKGKVRVTAEWTSPKSGVVTAFLDVTVGSPDAGVPDAGTPDAGVPDAGVPDAGVPDAGPGDGGVTTVNRVVLRSAKRALVTGTGDSTAMTATVTVTATGAPVVGTTVTFTTDRGSFASTPGTLSATATSDAQGVASATLYLASATAGTANVRAQALDGTGTLPVPFLNVASIVVQPDPSVKSKLGIQSSGRETTTPLLFKVLDAANQPAEGIEVSFALGSGSAGGANVDPGPFSSNAQGIVATTLQSGESVGSAVVVATVEATKSQGSPIRTTTSVEITGGKPSFRGLVVTCDRKNLGALTAIGGSPPTRALSATCRATLVDRNSNTVGLTTPVSWFAERGAISSANAVNGESSTTYSTSSNFVPADTAPLTSPAEPTYGGRYDGGVKNPRDQLINIVAVTSGEEEFADRNSNGRWDPGEWFLDLPEPFLDDNDNQMWDPGEWFADTNRKDCTTGVSSFNNMWDPPNGCWDDNTQIWAVTHIMWSGSLLPNPVFSSAPPWSVPVNSTVSVGFSWSDEYGNRIDKDGANMTVQLIGTRGQAQVSSPSLSGESLGLSVSYEKVEATEVDAGVFAINGVCNFGAAPPANPLTRCLYQYRFTGFGVGNTGTLDLINGPAQAPLPDGGVPPPINATIRLTGQNNYFTPVQVSRTAAFE